MILVYYFILPYKDVVNSTCSSSISVLASQFLCANNFLPANKIISLWFPVIKLIQLHIAIVIDCFLMVFKCLLLLQAWNDSQAGNKLTDLWRPVTRVTQCCQLYVTSTYLPHPAIGNSILPNLQPDQEMMLRYVCWGAQVGVVDFPQYSGMGTIESGSILVGAA